LPYPESAIGHQLLRRSATKAVNPSSAASSSSLPASSAGTGTNATGGAASAKLNVVTGPAGPEVPIEKLSIETCDGPPPLPSVAFR